MICLDWGGPQSGERPHCGSVPGCAGLFQRQWLFQRQCSWAPTDFPPGAPAPVAELLPLREPSSPGDTCPRLALTPELQSHHLQGQKTLEHSWFNLLFKGETEAHAGKGNLSVPTRSGGSRVRTVRRGVQPDGQPDLLLPHPRQQLLWGLEAWRPGRVLMEAPKAARVCLNIGSSLGA